MFSFKTHVLISPQNSGNGLSNREKEKRHIFFFSLENLRLLHDRLSS
jgi:hypothetical protein